MHHTSLANGFILLSIFFNPAASYYNAKKSPSKNAVLLSDVHALTVYANRKTTHRRVSAIPQLKCVGPSKEVCSLYQPDVMRCTNQGYEYDEKDVQWTCTAELPPEFKFGSTDVICEGYRDADDPWVFKGSCGVEYRLFLTDIGEQKYGKIISEFGGMGISTWSTFTQILFYFTTFVGVIWLLLSFCRRTQSRPGGGTRGWGNGGGWPPGPPPPYDYPGSGPRKTESWQPGFWSGALGGAAAGYALGNRRSSSRGDSSRFRSGSSMATPGPSGQTRESTGFGGTRRR
ncbi:hypothetical protein FQN57_006387 [Myotisia sp. PD_48]|nr:hypothetical protein FQN57_006387 [Myotisia sp. PD_48]